MIAGVRAGLRRLGGGLRSGLKAALDSPLVELDTRELLASWRAGLVLAVLTLAIGITALVAAQGSSEAPFRALVARFGMGHYLVAAAQLALGLALTFLVPIRAAGLLEGPRWRGFFDQLVTSGLPPWQYFLGRALAAQGFLALVFAGTAPLVLALALIDPPPVGAVLENHALLLVYAELLLAATLGLGALVNEPAAALVTVLLALGLGFLACLPVPSALVALSPARAIAGPFLALALEVPPIEAEVLCGPPWLFTFVFPLGLYGAALSLALGALAASCCLVGRPHAFAPGFNNFGAVVLAGDRRRAAVLRFRPALARRGELAFFFENHGPGHARLAPWVRLARATAVLLLASVLPLGALWNGEVLSLSKTGPGQIGLGFVVAALVFGVLALGAPLVLATAKSDARIDLALGRWRVPAVLGDLLAYVLVAGLVYGLFARTSEELLTSVAFAPTPGGFSFKTKLDAFAGWLEWARVLLVAGFALVLVQKVLGLRLHNAVAATVLAWGCVFATAFLPFALDPQDMKESDARARGAQEEKEPRSPEQNAFSVAALHLCPAFRMRLAVDPTVLEGVPLPPGVAWDFLAREGFWAIYPALDLLLLGAVFELVRLRRREARAELEGPSPGSV